MDEGKAADERAPKHRRAAWWAEIIFAAVIVIIVVGVLVPGYIFLKSGARRGEAKASLHEIQKAVERFAVDTGGTYPEYLIGGSAPAGDDPKNPYAQTSDALLRKGYLTAYPRNPFDVPQTVKAMQEQYKDPLRPGAGESKYGYRFGEDYTLMGQVLADFRYPKAPYLEGKKLMFHESYAEFGYPFWDIWPPGARKPKPFLPGEFFYKSYGIFVVANKSLLDPDRPIVPTSVDIYMLGLYGGPRDRGKDVLGDEFRPAFRPNTKMGGDLSTFTAPSWTRSIRKPNEKGEFLGSPYGLPPPEDDYGPGYGSPNGIPDAIILVLVPGEDTKGWRD